MMDEDNPKPTPSHLREFILNECKEPIVFQGLINDWKFLSWGLNEWALVFGDKSMPFRTGFKGITTAPQWERNCEVIYLKMKEFIELIDQSVKKIDHESKNWFYFDYKYMNEWFKENSSFLNEVSWDAFGFPEQGGIHSTIWIGSDGAHTPCHFDTYGCNLVAQVYGLKQWILFPPETSGSLLPSRVPYEESSVYSKHNFYCPDRYIANDIQKAWIVTLKPGEVLLVPRHWWHYVENTGIAISINTWLPLPDDCDSRIDECLTRLIVSQLCKETPNANYILNPNEDETRSFSLQENVALLDTCVQQYIEHQLKKEHANSEEIITEPKKMKLDSENSKVKTIISDYKTFLKEVSIYSGEELHHIFATKRDRFEPVLRSKEEVSSVTKTVENVINALCHPDVISMAKTKLCQELIGNNFK